jgi:toxin ParE1/3/4
MAAAERKRLEWSRIGLRELFDSFEFLASKNLSAAARIRDRVALAAEQLSENPFVGRAGQKRGTRELPIPGTPHTVLVTHET